MAMIQMFQPDEATPLPYVFQMIAPAENINQALRSFVFYEFYNYGFPFFGFSAALLWPLQSLGYITNLSLVMLILRQFSNVLPMLIALLLLVYMQDGFRTYRSVVLFGLLLCVPAVVQNNLWWHADGISFLFVALTLFFLQRDKLQFGSNFLFAAAMAGIATAIKLAGAYFFLAIGLTLLVGLYIKKISWKKLLLMAVAFLFIMALFFLIANPFLLSHWARTAYGYIMHKEFSEISQGYGVVYEKGLAAAWPDIRKSFGEAVFLLSALGAAIWGALRGKQRMLHGLILAWFFPVTILVLVVTHFKFQYWMPVALPLVSCLCVVFPENINFKMMVFKRSAIGLTTKIVHILVLLIIIIQVAFFIRQDISIIVGTIHKADNNPRIQFYDQSLIELSPLHVGNYLVYYDYRLYAPETTGWTLETAYVLLEYSYIQQKNFDILLLLEQRIRDYLNPNVTGIEPEIFARNQQFYRDADNGAITGYQLVYRNEVGLIFVRKDLFEKYYQK
jgi:hypothetical protein